MGTQRLFLAKKEVPQKPAFDREAQCSFQVLDQRMQCPEIESGIFEGARMLAVGWTAAPVDNSKFFFSVETIWEETFQSLNLGFVVEVYE
jgi:hypothetical protein